MLSWRDALRRMRFPCSVCVGIILPLVALVGSTTGSAGHGKAGKSVYEGTLGAGSAVTLVVESRDGKPRAGSFRASNVEYICDDETRPREDFGRIRVEFITRKRFLGELYRVGPRDFSQTYTQVKGKLTGGGRRVLGKFTYILDPYDPPGAEENQPECGTFGRVGWSAKRR